MFTESEMIEAQSKVGYIIKCTYEKYPIGYQFEHNGNRFTIIDYATREEVQAYCDSIGKPFLNDDPYFVKVITD